MPGQLCSQGNGSRCPGMSPGEERGHPGRNRTSGTQKRPLLVEGCGGCEFSCTAGWCWLSLGAQWGCGVRLCFGGWRRGWSHLEYLQHKTTPSLFPISSYQPIRAQFLLVLSALKHTPCLLLLLLPQLVNFGGDTLGKSVQNV